jgi:hypothetical protein
MENEKDKTDSSTNKNMIYTQIAGGAVGIVIGSVVLIWILRKILKK